MPALLAAAFLTAGCHGWREGTYRAPRGSGAATYAFGDPGDGWRPVRDVKGVQVAWVHDGLVGFIDIFSQCGEQGDSSLHQYTDHLRIDWTNWKVLEQREERLVGRAALRTIVEGELDGIPRRSELLVVKKNGCLFDLRYSASPEKFEEGRSAFARVVEGFGFPLTEG